MINFIIVEDNETQRNNVKNVIMSNMMKNKIEFNIVEFDDYSKELLKYIKNNHEDYVYILDLQLPNGDGIDIARLIRNKYNNWISPIIIITAHTSLYYEVYKQRLQILDFIGKCDHLKKNLSENIEICIKMLNKDKSYRYSYKNIDYNISLAQIDYIQRDGRRTKIVTKNKEYYQNISIACIIKELPNYFKISSKGTIVNMNNITKIDWNTNMVYFKDGKSDYVVSRSHKKELDSYEND